MKKYKVIRIIGLVLLVLGAATLILALMKGRSQSFNRSGAGGGKNDCRGRCFICMSLRLGKQTEVFGRSIRHAQ